MNLHILLLALCTLLGGPVSTAFARDQVKIVGSSTVYPFSTAVAERLGARGVTKTPVVESTGTGGGMKLFCSGVGPNTPDITNASRGIKPSERQLCAQHGVSEIAEIIIGSDGIAIANSTAAPVFNFTKAQLWKAMAAKGPKPALWNEVNPSLPAIPIQILIPPATSGTRDAWNELVMLEGCAPEMRQADREGCQLIREDGVIVEAGENDALMVQKIKANENLFGIFGFSYLDSNRDKIHPATIDQIEISLEAIQEGHYPIARPLFFYVKKAHIRLIPGMLAYINEFTSPAALGDEGYLTDLGLVPLPEQKRGEVRKMALDLKPLP